jgi:hypothetical protein
MKYLFFCFWSIIQISCYSKAEAVSGGLINPPDTLINYSILTIPHSDSLILSRGSKFLPYTIFQDSTYCFFEDCDKKLIRVYHFPSFKLNNIIPVSPDIIMCEGFHNFQFQDTSNYIALSDDGKIISFHDSKFSILADLRNIDLKSDYEFTTWLHDHNLPFQKSDSSIIFPISYNKNVKSDKIDKRPYSTALLKDGEMYFLGDRTIPHWSGVYFGLIDRTYQYFTDSTIVYMFSQNPEIRVFNYETNNLQIFECKSIYQNTEISPTQEEYNKDDLWNHMKTNGHYERLIFNPLLNVYYRFFFLPIPPKLPDNSTSTIRDRRISIMILDTNFNLLAEKLLPETVKSIHIAYPTADGLFINNGAVIAENGINLLKITHNYEH